MLNWFKYVKSIEKSLLVHRTLTMFQIQWKQSFLRSKLEEFEVASVFVE